MLPNILLRSYAAAVAIERNARAHLALLHADATTPADDYERAVSAVRLAHERRRALRLEPMAEVAP